MDRLRVFFILLVIAILALMAAAAAYAHSVQSGDIMVGHVWAKPMAPGSTTIDVYGPIFNQGSVADAVTGVTSPDAKSSAIVNWFKGSQMTEDFPLALAPAKPVALGPKSQFLRLSGVDKAYGAGTHFPITFHFQHAPDATIDVMVQGG